MSEPPDDAWLIALSATVSDGGVVDWARTEAQAPDAEARRLVRQLREVATILEGHRAVTASPPLAGGPGELASPSQWRHLLLLELVGAGGYGRVYRGWEPQLDREVAVKLLPGTSAGVSPLDEARHLAKIRNPNVIVVYGADEADGHVGIWMEYIEGQTLDAIVRERGPMSAREAAAIGLDLCSALSAIHGAGLLHRDVKAQNAMREVGGRIVLMDFSGADAADPTRSSNILSGTPLYMPPEVLDGSMPTAATDVYSLGVLLFFLVTARLPVEGATVGAVRAAHRSGGRTRLRDARPDLPDGFVEVVERAIDPDPRQRFATAGDLGHALAGVSSGHSAQLPSAAGARVRRGGAAAVALVVLVVALFGLMPSGRPESPKLVTRFTIGPPYIAGSWPRISPDGRYIVYGTFVQKRNRFWIRQLDRVEGRALAATTAIETPFWSPDSRTLAYFTDGQLFSIAVDGGAPQVLTAASAPRGGDWSGDTILFGGAGGIQRISATGGPAERVTTADPSQGDFQHGWPEFLPDGRRFLFLIRSSRPERSGLYVGSLDGAAPRRLGPAYSRVAFANGYLLYVREGTLIAHRFDPAAAVFLGDPVPLAQRVMQHAASDASFDVSTTGVLIYNLTHGYPATQLVLFDSRGREVRPISEVGSFAQPRFSPDGERLVAEKIDPEHQAADLWLYGIARPSATRLTAGSSQEISPVWSPDGSRIAFSSKRGAFYDVYVKKVDGVEGEQLIYSSSEDKLIEGWSPNGRFLTAAVSRAGLALLTLGSPAKLEVIRPSGRPDSWQSQLAPGGDALAYVSGETGTPEVYVEPFPPTGVRAQVSTRGGTEPQWRGTGRELLYVDPDGVLTAVTLGTRGLKPSAPQPLFRVNIADPLGRTDWAVSPDGRHFAFNTFVADPMVPPIDVVVNWEGLLAR